MKTIISLAIFCIYIINIFAFESRTVGGEIITNEDKSKPWLVKFADSSSDLAFCSGSLINENFALTAYRCIARIDPSTLNEVSVNALGSSVTSGMKNVYLPYEDEQERLEADLVVVELSSPIVLDSYITLPQKDTIDEYYDTNQSALLLGFGINNLNKIGVASQVEVSILNKEECLSKINKTSQSEDESEATEVLQSEDVAQEEIEEEKVLKICDNTLQDKEVQKKAIGMCAGDTGGPLVVEKGESFIQLGLSSEYLKDANSLDCGINTGVYPNISFHLAWINEAIEAKLSPSTYEQNTDIGTDANEGFYMYLKSLPVGFWYLIGPGMLPTGLDVSKIPSSSFSVYLFRDNTMKKITHLSKNLISLNLYEGFWLYME